MNSKNIVRLLALTVAIQTIIPAAGISAPDSSSWTKTAAKSQPGKTSSSKLNGFGSPNKTKIEFEYKPTAPQSRDFGSVNKSKIEFEYKPPTPQLRDNNNDLNKYGTYRKQLPDLGKQSVLPGRYEAEETSDEGVRVRRKPPGQKSVIAKPQDEGGDVHAVYKPDMRDRAKAAVEAANEERRRRVEEELGRKMREYTEAARQAREGASDGIIEKPAKRVTNPKVATEEACPGDDQRVIEKPAKQVSGANVTTDVRREDNQRVIEKPAKQVTNPKVTTDVRPEHNQSVIEKPAKQVSGANVTTDVRPEGTPRVIEKPAKEVTNPKVTTEACPEDNPRIIEKPAKQVTNPKVVTEECPDDDQRVIEKPAKQITNPKPIAHDHSNFADANTVPVAPDFTRPATVPGSCGTNGSGSANNPGNVAANPSAPGNYNDRIQDNVNIPQPQWSAPLPQAQADPGYQCVCPHCGHTLGVVVVRGR